MSYSISRVESFEIVGPYTLLVRFDDDKEQEIDFSPVLAGGVTAAGGLLALSYLDGDGPEYGHIKQNRRGE